MEIVFLLILVLLMVIALTSGFPVAFSLPGAAIITIGLAALSGFLFEGDVSAYFAQDGPVEWLNAGVTNFRSLYWVVERDTLIAIPLFVFMGIMLQRSRIAEDLLVAMAQLFGPVPGGLGISVVFVGALLAATTGIVGATVIAMGLISLPAMMRNNYSRSLASGVICASGTLGQIIPPSIVLIILADQLSSAADQASTLRKQAYKAATGEFSMPSHLDVVSASAGDMFMGAFIPGMILVALYMLYILISAIIRPQTAPPVAFDGKYDSHFFKQVLLALVPPLALIFVVLGSILTGVATVNQAGAIGAIGAVIMGGYRLYDGGRLTFVPAALAVFSVLGILVVLSLHPINIKNMATDSDRVAVMLAGVFVVILLIAVFWSLWRSYKIDNTLREVMIETAKTTSMVFIILLGAAMLTSAFRAFGGEELVRHYLTGLPGGFWTQFLVVMLVMFLLGFFLDFIEIAVVVVPIVAPILLANPEANITAVWFGVMVGLNIQTSFLTPPFGFALFYLRGVAPPEVKTTQIYKGAVAFIGLQLIGLGIAGYFPPLVNYLPFSTYLTSDNAPPPVNPRLQQCMRDELFVYYDENRNALTTAIDKARGLDLSVLPAQYQDSLRAGFDTAAATFGKVQAVREAKAALDAYADEYRVIHSQVRDIEKDISRRKEAIGEIRDLLSDARREDEPDQQLVAELQAQIDAQEQQIAALGDTFPAQWEAAYARWEGLSKAHDKAVRDYNMTVDGAYQPLPDVLKLIGSADELAAFEARFDELVRAVNSLPVEEAETTLKAGSDALGELAGVSAIKSQVYKAYKAMKPGRENPQKALQHIAQARELFDAEVSWRQAAATRLAGALTDYDEAIRDSIGLRLQARLSDRMARKIALCQSYHRDVSLSF
ncbi:TRAP transporter large permease subunit [Granulosicoccaceae sp. 1_MG-2023]|nr:TRAP transporter large permease subunit [Granulosicoccaceae sp. 1_MG-2023]